MKKSLFLVVALSLILLFTGCSSSVNEEKLTDEQAVHKFLNNFEKAFLNKDLDSLVNLLATSSQYEENWFITKGEAREFFEDYIKQNDFEQFEFANRSEIRFAYQNTKAGLYATRITKPKNRDLESLDVWIELDKETNNWKLGYCGGDD